MKTAMSNLIISTTPTLEIGTITNYYGIVTANIVLGTNALSDMVASLTDFFGGQSGTYQNKLDVIYNDVIKAIEVKVTRRSPKVNAIVGFHVDFNEISGKGKQMFFATAMGTMCHVEIATPNQDHLDPDPSPQSVSEEEILITQQCEKIKRLIADEQHNYILDWEFILNHNLPQLAFALTDKLIKYYHYNQPTYYHEILSNYTSYFKKLPEDFAFAIVFDKLKDEAVLQYSLAKERKLFDAKKVLGMIKDGNLHNAIH